MNIRLTSDPHFLHDKIVEYAHRPANHNERIFNGLMQIPKQDTLICLGDLSIGRDIEVYETYIKPLQCNKILVRGNHDRKSDNRYYEHGWNFICYYFYNRMYGRKLIFSHQPLPDLPEDVINIHGHRHDRKDIVPFDGYHGVLFSCENEGYKPVKLDRFLRDRKII